MLTNLYVFHLLDTSIYIYIKCNKEHPRNKTHNSIFTYIIKIYFTITYSVGFRTVCQLLLWDSSYICNHGNRQERCESSQVLEIYQETKANVVNWGSPLQYNCNDSQNQGPYIDFSVTKLNHGDFIWINMWFHCDGMMTLEVVEVFVIEHAYLPYHYIHSEKAYN